MVLGNDNNNNLRRGPGSTFQLPELQLVLNATAIFRCAIIAAAIVDSQWLPYFVENSTVQISKTYHHGPVAKRPCQWASFITSRKFDRVFAFMLCIRQ